MDGRSRGGENREINSLVAQRQEHTLSSHLRTIMFDQLNLWGERRARNGCEMGEQLEEETDDPRAQRGEEGLNAGA